MIFTDGQYTSILSFDNLTIIDVNINSKDIEFTQLSKNQFRDAVMYMRKHYRIVSPIGCLPTIKVHTHKPCSNFVNHIIDCMGEDSILFSTNDDDTTDMDLNRMQIRFLESF